MCGALDKNFSQLKYSKKKTESNALKLKNR